MKTLRTIMLVAAAMILAAPALAQQGMPPRGPMQGAFDEEGEFEGGPGRGGPGGGMSEERREEVRKKIEAVRIYRLTEELKLDPQTAAKMAALLGSVEQKRRTIVQEQMGAMRELRDSLRAGSPDERKLKGLLEKLEKNHHEMSEIRDKEMKGLKELLTVEQQARYLVFQQEFMREMRGMIAGARGGGQGPGPGPGMRGGMGPGGQGRQPR